MSRALIGAGLCGVALLAAGSARADIMRWYWEVEVNGQGVHESRPVPVEAGDQVDIRLWAEWDPHGEGFAWAVFAISTADSFFSNGTVTTDQSAGYGLNESLDDLADNGVFADADGNGQFDTIDHIVASQYPAIWNSAFDRSNPIVVYRVGWEVAQDVWDRIELRHSAALNGDFGNAVYTDENGAFEQYGTRSELLVFVPTPSGAPVLLACSLAWLRHVRRRSA